MAEFADLSERITRRLTIDESGCWVWGGCCTRGYGVITVGSTKDNSRRTRRVHRLVYELLVGPIPAGLELDHLCRVRGCANPAHLEAVTHRENVLRGEGLPARNAVKTHCPQGHRYTADNTYLTCRGGRMCRTCSKARAS